MRSVLLVMAAHGLPYLPFIAAALHSFVQPTQKKKKSRQGELEREILKREILSVQEIQSE